MDIKEEAILGDQAGNHWYYASKAAFLERSLPRRTYRHVLDVGAGSGFFARYLLERGLAGRATCVDIGYDREWTQTVAGRQLDHVNSYTGGEEDLLLFMDVLEHVPDDVALLGEYVSRAPSGSDVFISVPAFRFMWSAHDEFLEHYRRYVTAQLRQVVGHAGLEVLSCSYGFGGIFPIALARRLLDRWWRPNREPSSDLRLHSASVNSTLKAICAIEKPLVRFNRLAGLSVFCTARKP
jgi:SAM-dependent methyltransferase